MESIQFFKKTCDGGWGDGCVQLGLIEKEKGNTFKSAQLFQKACEWIVENIDGCFNLGVLENGRGSTVKAKKLFQKACQKGHVKACNLLKNLSKK